jgi:hypothetical protein
MIYEQFYNHSGWKSSSIHTRIRLEAQRITLIEYYHVLSTLNQQANQLENGATHLEVGKIQIKCGIFTSPIPLFIFYGLLNILYAK